MRIHVSGELETTPERAWQIYFDPQFHLELCQTLNVESLNESVWEDTAEQLKMTYHVVARRNLPDWVKKVIPNVRIAYMATDIFNKKNQQIKMSLTPDVLPSKITGHGTWSIRTIRPGVVERTYEGDITINIPLVGRKMEEKLVPALEADFGLTNELMARWVAKDKAALAAGQPLPELKPPSPLSSRYPNGYRG